MQSLYSDDPKNEWPSPIGFHTWRKSPFALNYMDISGFEGQFLGFLTVLIQATFSFFGSEVPGIVRPRERDIYKLLN